MTIVKFYMSIYQDIILDHYNFPRNKGKLQNPTHAVDLTNPLCGDKIQMEVEAKDGKVVEIGFTGEGCAISIASASMVTEYAKGKTIQELLKLDKDFVLELLGIELTPNRLKCALLSLEALHKTIQST